MYTSIFFFWICPKQLTKDMHTISIFYYFESVGPKLVRVWYHSCLVSLYPYLQKKKEIKKENGANYLGII